MRAKVAKAEEFLTAAELSLELSAYNAATSLAVSAGINASDSMILAKGGVLPNASDHQQSTRTLRRIDPSAAVQLNRLLGLKNKSQYALQMCTRSDADVAVKAAEKLLEKVKALHARANI